MKITVTLLGRLKAKLPLDTKGEARLDLAAGATPAQVLAHFGLPATGSYLITRNGERVFPEAYATEILAEGDVLRITPPLAGG